MDSNDLVPYLNKRIQIVININNSTLFYTGKIEELNDDTILIIDKYNKLVTLSYSNIVKVQEVV